MSFTNLTPYFKFIFYINIHTYAPVSFIFVYQKSKVAEKELLPCRTTIKSFDTLILCQLYVGMAMDRVP